MQRVNGEIRLAATDLSDFVQCKYLTLLKLAQACGVDGVPPASPPFARLEALKEKGLEHERAVLDGFRTIHRDGVVEIPDRDQASEAERRRMTAEALAASVPVIYQGVLGTPQEFGLPDFLVRAEILDPGDTGGGYVVLDAKLARSAKAAALLQTTFYSRLLAHQTGIAPRWMYLQLADGAQPAPFRVADYDAYERATSSRMRVFIEDATPGFPIESLYPEKVEHCEICSWRKECAEKRLADDDLSRVAGATSRQRKLLKDAGIASRRALATAAEGTHVPGLDPASFERLRLQAEIQVLTTDGDHVPPLAAWRDSDEDLAGQRANADLYHQDVPPKRDALRGLFALPAHDDADLFFDLEASRFFGGGEEGHGLEYLFGYVDGLDGRYYARWAFDRKDERAAFEWFIQMVHERWAAHPGMHVYHYNHYEPTTMSRLADRHETMAELVGAMMGYHGTMEQETDALLRARVFVDLYPIFRQSTRAGIESYSLKQTERVAGYDRREDLAGATEQLIAFEKALDEGRDVAEADADARRVIASYNEDDCRATLALRDWLEGRRSELEDKVGPFPRPPLATTPAEPPAASVSTRLLEAREDKLDHARALLSGLIEYQRREDRPTWWEYFQIRGLDAEGLVGSKAAIGGLEYIGRARDADGSPRMLNTRAVFEFTFPPQEYRVHPGSKLNDPREFHFETVVDDEGVSRQKCHDGLPWEIAEIDEASGRLFVANSEPPGSPDEMPRALVAILDLRKHTPTESLEAYGEEVLARGELNGRPLAEALLLRVAPTVAGDPLGAPEPGVQVSHFAQSVALSMDRGCLPIQGPPGTGKTYTGARIITALHGDDRTRRFGVTAYTHAAVRNFLKELREQDPEGHLRIGQVGNADQVLAGIKRYPSPGLALAALAAGEIDVLGGTAWLWSHEDARVAELVDTLFIDEAGQFPLAFAVAIAGAARERLILLGDPQQLPQVTQGSHPSGAGASALGHVLGEGPVLAEEQGIFLDQTRRMHGDITAFVSRAFYLDELRGDPMLGLDRQAVLGDGALGGSGIRLSDVMHDGNDSSSPEEASAVSEIVADLLTRGWVDRSGEERPLRPEDIKIVTPYNAQIREILRQLARAGVTGVDVGTVDRFQGSQAPVVLYSMATSTAEDAPRGMEFLYQLNRLNVAASRAMALVGVVMSPDLVRVDCKTPRQMQLASAHCLLREAAHPLAG